MFEFLSFELIVHDSAGGWFSGLLNPPPKNRNRLLFLTQLVAVAGGVLIFGGSSYLPADPSDIKLRVLPSYTFVPMSEVEQHVQQMVAARAQAVPEPDPVCNLPAAKRQATITSYFRK